VTLRVYKKDTKSLPLKKIERTTFFEDDFVQMKQMYAYDLTTLAKHRIHSNYIIISERSRFRIVGCCSGWQWIIEV